MAVNGQYNDPPFGMSPAIADTGAPGSVGVSASESAPALATVPVRGPYQSAQTPADMVTVSVGDTLSMSSDAVVPRDTGDPLTGVPWRDLSETGAGRGTVHAPRPAGRQ